MAILEAIVSIVFVIGLIVMTATVVIPMMDDVEQLKDRLEYHSIDKVEIWKA